MEKRNNNEQKKIDNVLYILGLSSAVICCVYLLISKITGFRIENYLYPCLFHTVTGYYCPGCGGTRAVCALFQGHFLISFLEHPFVPYAAVLCAWFLLSRRSNVSHTISCRLQCTIKTVTSGSDLQSLSSTVW